MEIHELRKGILVYADVCMGSTRVHSIMPQDIVDYEDGKVSIEPIPLTEEWLVKFGFAWYAQVKPKGYWMSGFCIKKIDSMLIHYQTGVGLKYVHQLQNLYYCLVGEELTIKP